MEDCCDEEPDPPPFKGGKRSDKSKKQEAGASKKKDAAQPRKKKESKLNAIEEEMREKEQQIEYEHTQNWYLGEDYLQELQHRLDTCFRVMPIDPSILSVYKCYLENKDDPMKCRNFSTVLKKDTQEKMKRFVEKSQKMLGDKSKK